ncbi:MAG: hypothetical protein GX330_00270 [Bacteroidales bacterium]|nr:hypothetical protein [Bacteroidales bacterium]
MNRNIFKSVTVLFVLLIITSCNKTTKTISKIDSEIIITMKESSSKRLQLRFSTAKIYPCCNYPIDLSYKKRSNTIDIALKNVIETEFCLTALGPATADIELKALSIGTYILNLNIGNSKYAGELIVSSGNYRINFADNPNYRFTNTPLNKLPKNTIWGYVGYHVQESSLLVEAFLDDLMGLGAEKKKYNPGYYTYFEIDENGEITYGDALLGYWFAQPFIFCYSGKIDNIEELIKQYARNYNDKLSITLNTDDGKEFFSYRY